MKNAIEFPILNNEKNNSNESAYYGEPKQLVYYEQEAGNLIISMPEIDNKWGSRSYNGQMLSDSGEYLDLYYSFLLLGVFNESIGSYKASNAIGLTIDVTKMDAEYFGVGILSTAEQNYTDNNTQIFSFKFERDEALSVLKKGKLVLEIKLEFKYFNNNERPLLILDEKSQKPTIDNPKKLDIKYYAIPARLLNITLFDNKGSVVHKEQGHQIYSSPVK